jgi:hypothetical protein
MSEERENGTTEFQEEVGVLVVGAGPTGLTLAGARSQLLVWDGLGHCFYLDPDQPEALEIEEIIVDFFAQTLDGAGT